MNVYKFCNAYGILLGLFLLSEGIWGLISPVIFGGSALSSASAIIFILLGCAGLYYGNKGWARNYNIILGILLLLVSLLWFINGTNEMMVRVFNINSNIALLDLIAGIIALISGIITPKKKHKYNIVLLY